MKLKLKPFYLGRKEKAAEEEVKECKLYMLLFLSCYTIVCVFFPFFVALIEQL